MWTSKLIVYEHRLSPRRAFLTCILMRHWLCGTNQHSYHYYILHADAGHDIASLDCWNGTTSQCLNENMMYFGPFDMTLYAQTGIALKGCFGCMIGASSPFSLCTDWNATLYHRTNAVTFQMQSLIGKHVEFWYQEYLLMIDLNLPGKGI